MKPIASGTIGGIPGGRRAGQVGALGGVAGVAGAAAGGARPPDRQAPHASSLLEERDGDGGGLRAENTLRAARLGGGADLGALGRAARGRGVRERAREAAAACASASTAIPSKAAAAMRRAEAFAGPDIPPRRAGGGREARC